MASPKIDVIVRNAATGTGEGPYWDNESKTLYHIDLVAGDAHRWNSLTNENEVISVSDRHLTFLIPRKSGGFIAGKKQSLIHFDWENPSEQTILAEVEEGMNTRWNDGKCDTSGRLWAGTMCVEIGTVVPVGGLGSLYSMDLDGTVKKHADKFSISNGLAWSLDDTVMYFADSMHRCVYAFDYDKNTGLVTNQRVSVKYPDDKLYGVPDGMCSDTEGKLWVACYDGDRIVRFDPETGKIIQELQVPVKNPTSCCFGGENQDELFITSSRTGYTDEELRTKDPLAGSVFKVTGLGFKGPENIKFHG
ncbi:regucalcin-like isoform X1 [Tubulanus polymorphus]|uniref:regucalcin-like isoform X1 n=1 Tax=Tubulanus polymorphus TaxID=672921 RepID=UPI003DA22808